MCIKYFENEIGELVEKHIYENESGETVVQMKTYQNNGWTRINESYEDGTTTETFERETVY